MQQSDLLIGDTKKIEATLYQTEAANKNILLYSHGLFSSRKSKKITLMSPFFAANGFSSFAFDYSFAKEASTGFTNLSFFEELEELKLAVDYVRSQGYDRIHIVGSSAGAVVAFLYAAQDANSLSSITAIASPVDLQDLVTRISDADNIQDLDEDGMTPVSGVFIKNSFFKEIMNIDLVQVIDKISIPMQIIHGTQDELIPLDSIKEFYAQHKPDVPIIEIDQGDHSLYKEDEVAKIQQQVLAFINNID